MTWTTAAIIAGLLGTVASTTYIALGRLLHWPRVDMIEIPGSMIASDFWRIHIIGTVFHFAMGVVFALVYAWLWRLGVGEPLWWWGLLFGLVHGAVTLLSMPFMLAVHPNPPELTAIFSRLAVQVWGGHALYGLVVAVVYRLLMS